LHRSLLETWSLDGQIFVTCVTSFHV
jgi:hypothetical protein